MSRRLMSITVLPGFVDSRSLGISLQPHPHAGIVGGPEGSWLVESAGRSLLHPKPAVAVGQLISARLMEAYGGDPAEDDMFADPGSFRALGAAEGGGDVVVRDLPGKDDSDLVGRRLGVAICGDQPVGPQV